MFPPAPRVAIAGSPPWADDATAALRAAGFEILSCPHPAHFLDDMIDHYPALILTDGSDANWRFWIVAPKTEQATRRLPVLTVVSSEEAGEAARQAGADLTLRQDDLRRLPDLVRAHARMLEPATVERLRCQCAEPLPARGLEAIAKFNAGAYYAQHDIFEAMWMAEIGPVRDLYRVILQVGVAYYHITRGNWAGAAKLLRRTAQWFAILPDVCQGVDVRQLEQDAQRVRAALAALDPVRPVRFDLALLRPVKQVPTDNPHAPS